MTPSPSSSRYTADDWDDVRAAFVSSILADTPLSSLAQNLEGADWPIKRADETPASYLSLSFRELRERLALRGQPPRVADQLIDILRETLAFDDPFGEMVAQSDQAAPRENPLLKSLAKLGIPEDFPVAFSALDAGTLEFCRLEGIVTLREFAVLSQRMAQNVIVGGDFRSLLNALSSIDERTLARHLPFRPGAEGLHYIEGLAHAVRAQPAAVRAAWRKRLGEPLAEAERLLASKTSGRELAGARESLAARGAALGSWFEDDCRELRRRLAAGEDARTLAAVLREPGIGGIVADLLETTLQGPSRRARESWWSRLIHRRKN